MTNENRRMSAADRAGLAARSPEGHAARSMGIKGREEDWIRIQANTFCNWLNVNLADKELNSVTDLETDLQSGVILVNLVEKLQKRKIRHNKKPINQHQELENISIALDAVQDDGIKLVNIGNSDIHHGNLKLILGLIWSLIAHYQLGASNFPPKKLILAWLKIMDVVVLTNRNPGSRLKVIGEGSTFNLKVYRFSKPWRITPVIVSSLGMPIILSLETLCKPHVTLQMLDSVTIGNEYGPQVLQKAMTAYADHDVAAIYPKDIQSTLVISLRAIIVPMEKHIDIGIPIHISCDVPCGWFCDSVNNKFILMPSQFAAAKTAKASKDQTLVIQITSLSITKITIPSGKILCHLALFKTITNPTSLSIAMLTIKEIPFALQSLLDLDTNNNLKAVVSTLLSYVSDTD